MRHDKSGTFILHDRERFAIVWDPSAVAHPSRQRDHYVWVEKAARGHLEPPRLILFDERGEFLGHADVAKAKWIARRFTERYRGDLAELVD